MNLLQSENPTRQKILLLLKKYGRLSTEDMRKYLNITHMGVRQHLLSLEKKGLVTYDPVRHGIGRPNFIYRLTDGADRYFPKKYDKFALDILKSVEASDGRKKIDRLFKQRKDKIFEQKKSMLEDLKGTLSDKVSSISGMLQDDGYIVDLTENNGSYVLKQFNCPISVVSNEYPEACKYELELYRDYFGVDVQRTQCLAEGGLSCEYVIPKK